MESLIGLVNELQRALALVKTNSKMDLPQIAVVGNQSAGKSSVLENIVGRDFLPRGSGIVTRRPLVLQLVHANGEEEYGTFAHSVNGHRFHDFHQIRDEISRETDRVSGVNKGLSSIPIHLRICSPRIPDLTLIDLPGMSKVPVGDQPNDIELQIRSMILAFIDKPNCLILAVIAANSDLATSDALKLVQQVDPDGRRTIGVLTKLDLMDEGTDARNVLLNKVFPLRFGYTAMVNRSQQEISGQKEIFAALEDERRFFSQHPAYQDLNDRVGTECLTAKLSNQLQRHIAMCLPDLKIHLAGRIQDAEKQLVSFKTEFDYSDPCWKSKASVLLGVRFAQRFRIELLGNSDDMALDFNKPSCGAKIRRTFLTDYPELLSKTEFAQEHVMKRCIGFAIQNIHGVRAGLFTPDQAFDLIVRQQLKNLYEPTTAVLETSAVWVYEALDIALQELGQFPLLQDEIRSDAKEILLKLCDRTGDNIRQLLDFENAYINTKHDDFVGFTYAEQKAHKQVLQRRNPGEGIKCSGYLTICSGFGRSKKFWFVLTTDSLAWFTDATKSDRIYTVPIDYNVQFQDLGKNNRFAIYRDNANVYKDKSVLELQAPSPESLKEWEKCLIQVGIFGGRKTSGQVSFGEDLAESSAMDPWLERQVESLWILIDSYMRIVCRTLLDIVPKCVVCSFIKQSVSHFETHLISDLSRIPNADDIMKEDAEAVQKKKDLETVRDACEKTLEKLRNLPLPNLELSSEEREYIRHKKSSTASLAKFQVFQNVTNDNTKCGGDMANVHQNSTSNSGRLAGNSNVQMVPVGKATPLIRDTQRRNSSSSLKKALQSMNTASQSQFY